MLGILALLVLGGMLLHNLARQPTPLSRAVLGAFVVWAVVYMTHAGTRTRSRCSCWPSPSPVFRLHR
ncbi:MAG: hypothetical protein HC915_14290 [Anaerolineae bacterium]|nr:hypothetical protein [Anaerolineae bacterium]